MAWPIREFDPPEKDKLFCNIAGSKHSKGQ
jgi:hypothetical protein